MIKPKIIEPSAFVPVKLPKSRFVEQVVEYTEKVDETLTKLSRGVIDSVLHEDVDDLVARIEWCGQSGHGYLASSLKSDFESEVLWTSVVVNAFSNAGFQSVIFPIDDFYSYLPKVSGICQKLSCLTQDKLATEPQSKYAVILSDFSSSQVFTDNTLKLVPFQNNAESFEFKNRAKYICPLIGRTGSLELSLSEITNMLGDSEEHKQNAQLLLCCSLLLDDAEAWQSLWYESQGNKGIPLFIVAPKLYHDAVNRLNYFCGHGVMDYEYRAGNKLGAHKVPIFDVVDGIVKTKKYFLELESNQMFERTEDRECLKGPGVIEIKQRIDYIFSALKNTY